MIKVLELFGGIGSPRMTLNNLGIEFEVVDYVENDKYAVKSYNAMYDEEYTVQDVTEWDKDIEVDLIVHGSPCQDFSLAGRLAGGEEGSGTRSSLLWETVRIVKKVKPKYIIWENVRTVLSKRSRPVFDKYLNELQGLGYTNFYSILNSKDFNIPQVRARLFVVSILNNDPGSFFRFPTLNILNTVVMDYLESVVDDKFYLSDKMVDYIRATNKKWTMNNNGAYINKEVDSTINTKEGTRRCDASNYIAEGLPKQLDLQNCILVKNNTKQGYLIARKGDSIDFNYPNSKTRRGRVQKQKIQTLTNNANLGIVLEDLKVRRLIPLECWRLQGFPDRSFHKASKVNSNTQLYKQAGNTITVNVIQAVLKIIIRSDRS